MTDRLALLSEQMLAAAQAAGADGADALALTGASVSIRIRNGGLEQAERAEATDIGLRVFLGQRSAIVSASDTSPDTITQMAERAVAMAREAIADPHAGLAAPEQLARDWDLAALEIDDPAAEPEPDHLADMARRAEAAALAIPGISQSLGASAGHSRNRLFLATSAGFAGGYGRSSTGIGCSAVSGEGTGMERDHDSDSRAFAADLRAPEAIGRRAGERAAARHGARQAATGRYPVLFDARISGSLIGHLMAAANGAAVARGASWLREARGEAVLPTGIDLIAEPHRPRAAATRPFDGEGLPTATRHIVTDGVLQEFSLDLASARKLGLAPTASARRGVSAPPSPGAGNLRLTEGAQSRADLLREMGRGLLVTSLIGSTINPNTGDYSRGASGFWVEGGEIAYPVNQITIAGNLRDMLGRIRPANDAEVHLSRLVPSLLIEGMTLAGS